MSANSESVAQQHKNSTPEPTVESESGRYICGDAAFTPYFTEDEADRAGPNSLPRGTGGDASVSDFIVRALREVKRLQRRYNQGRKWEPVLASGLRRDNLRKMNCNIGRRAERHGTCF